MAKFDRDSLFAEEAATPVRKQARNRDALFADEVKPSALSDSDVENYLAGVGKGFVDVGRGLRQFGVLAGNTIGLVDDATVDRTMAEVDEAKALDAELMNSKAGLAGAITGGVAATVPAFLVPGAAAGTATNIGRAAAASGNTARAAQAAKVASAATKVGQVVNPISYRGAAAVGAATGAVQPVASDESRLANVGLGATGGTVGQAAGRVIGAGARAVAGRIGNQAPEVAPITREAVEQAQQAAQSAGIDWVSLSHDGKLQLIKFVDDAIKAESDVTADMAARQAMLSALPKPITGTRGQLNQDFYQQEREALLADIPVVGSGIRGLREDQRQLLVDNLDAMTAGLGGKAVPAQKTGELIRSPLQEQYAGAKKVVSGLYKDAEAAGGSNVVLTRELADWFNANAGDEAADSLLNRAVRRGIVSVNEAGVVQPGKATLASIYELRKNASVMGKDGGSKGYISGDFKGVIDNIFEAEGGHAYAPAIAARRQLARDFAENRGVGQLLERSGKYGLDPLVPDEKVFDRLVVSGSMKNLTDYLARKPDIMPIRTELVSRLRGSAIDDVNGKAVFKAAGLEKELNKIGREKLNILMGKPVTDNLYSLVQSAKLLERRQPSIAGGSQTAARGAMLGQMFLNNLGKIPVIGGAAETVGKVTAGAASSRSATKPVQEAVEKSISRQKAPNTRNALRLMMMGAAPYSSDLRDQLSD